MINILIVANQKSVGQAWQVYLNAESDLQVVGLAANGKTALDKIAQLKPDIVLIDLKIPQLDGLKTTQIIRDRFPQIKTIVFICGKRSRQEPKVICSKIPLQRK